MKWYLMALKKYAVFSGRACRKEYWLFVLFYIIFAWGIYGVDVAMGTGGTLHLFYELFIFIPALAVMVRRLHDTDRSGKWLFIIVIPIIGPLAIFFFLLQPGTDDENFYGPAL